VIALNPNEDDYKNAVRLAQDFWSTLKDMKIKPPNIVGHVGEILVMRELIRKGIAFEPVGGQAGYDLVLTDKPPNTGRLEVKTSTLKGWYGTWNYGWTIQRRGARKRNYNFLVCVGIHSLIEALDGPEFFVFTGSEALSSQDVDLPGYSSVQKKLHVFANLDDFNHVAEKLEERGKGYNITPWDRKVNKNLDDYRNAWDVLR
jgi:hypothetical protein